MEKIAVFLNEDKQLDNFYNCNMIMVYEGDNDDCLVTEEKSFDKINPAGARQIIESTGKIAKLVEDCSAIVFGEIAGIAYTVFDKAQFNIFTIEDNSVEAIKSIFGDLFEFEKELAQRKKDLLELKPRETSEGGVYYFDLAAALKENPDMSSKKLLKEFFDSVPFIQLRLKVDHLPPWIENDERFDISSKDSDQGKKVVITKKKCY